MGETLQSALNATGANFWSFTAASLVVVGLPRLILSLLLPRTPAAAVHAFQSGALVLSLIVFMCSLLLQAIIVRATVTFMDGRRPDIMECARAALKVLLPLIGISLLLLLGVGAGMLLLIIPGIFLAIAWSVVVPAEVVERVGVFSAFSRSWSLTQGFRWPVFGILLVMALLTLIISLIGSMLGAVFNLVSLIGSGGSTPLFLVVTAIAASIAAVFQAATAAAIYSELRRVKEGATPQSLAAVFD